jgi:Lrp/AsnC family transcriptional regulator for asnA, asnC and gidA
MDEIDHKILTELTKNAQVPFSRIAKKIGLSPQTVQMRHAKMKEEGAILRAGIIVDLSKLGYQGKAVLMIANAPNHKKQETIEALKKMRDVFIETEIIGDFDVVAVAAIRDFRSAINLVNKIRALPSVDNVVPSLSTDTAFPVGKGFNELFQTKE